MADITTTTKKEGERMSELTDTIDRLEQWAEYWEPHQVPELIADLRTMIAAAKAIQRALQVLQRAQRYELVSRAIGPTVVESTSGDYVDADDVKAAIDILQEGQQ